MANACPVIAGAVSESWAVKDLCSASITVTFPSLPASPVTFNATAVYRSQWHDGRPPEGTAGAWAAGAEAEAADGGGAGTALGGFWSGDVLVGQQLCGIALELDPLVRHPARAPTPSPAPAARPAPLSKRSRLARIIPVTSLAAAPPRSLPPSKWVALQGGRSTSHHHCAPLAQPPWPLLCRPISCWCTGIRVI